MIYFLLNHFEKIHVDGKDATLEASDPNSEPTEESEMQKMLNFWSDKDHHQNLTLELVNTKCREHIFRLREILSKSKKELNLPDHYVEFTKKEGGFLGGHITGFELKYISSFMQSYIRYHCMLLKLDNEDLVCGALHQFPASNKSEYLCVGGTMSRLVQTMMSISSIDSKKPLHYRIAHELLLSFANDTSLPFLTDGDGFEAHRPNTLLHMIGMNKQSFDFTDVFINLNRKFNLKDHYSFYLNFEEKIEKKAISLKQEALKEIRVKVDEFDKDIRNFIIDDGGRLNLESFEGLVIDISNKTGLTFSLLLNEDFNSLGCLKIDADKVIKALESQMKKANFKTEKIDSVKDFIRDFANIYGGNEDNLNLLKKQLKDKFKLNLDIENKDIIDPLSFVLDYVKVRNYFLSNKAALRVLLNDDKADLIPDLPLNECTARYDITDKNLVSKIEQDLNNNLKKREKRMAIIKVLAYLGNKRLHDRIDMKDRWAKFIEIFLLCKKFNFLEELKLNKEFSDDVKVVEDGLEFFKNEVIFEWVIESLDDSSSDDKTNAALKMIDELDIDMKQKSKTTGDFLIETAIREGNNKIAKALLGKRVEFDFENDADDLRILHLAAEKCNSETIHILLKHVTQNETYSNLMFKAINSENIEVFKVLLDMEIDPNFIELETGTSLINAILSLKDKEKRKEMFLLLVAKKGFDANLPDKNNITPLFKAVLCGDLFLVKFFFRKSTNLNQKASLDSERENCNLLHAAAFNGEFHILKFLLENGISRNELNSLNSKGESVLMLALNNLKDDRLEEEQSINALKGLIDLGMDIDFKDELGNTLLSLAVQNSKVKVAKFLLQAGADPRIDNNEQMSPFQYALNLKQLEILQDIIDSEKFDAEYIAKLQENDDNILLKLIELGISDNMLSTLVQKGFCLKFDYENGKNLLHKMIEILILDKDLHFEHELILEDGKLFILFPNKNDERNKDNPLFLIIFLINKFLKSKPFGFNTADNEGVTPLSLIFKTGKHHEMTHRFADILCCLLIRGGEFVNIPYKDGESHTILDEIIENEFVESVNTLLQFQFDFGKFELPVPREPYFLKKVLTVISKKGDQCTQDIFTILNNIIKSGASASSFLTEDFNPIKFIAENNITIALNFFDNSFFEILSDEEKIEILKISLTKNPVLFKEIVFAIFQNEEIMSLRSKFEKIFLTLDENGDNLMDLMAKAVKSTNSSSDKVEFEKAFVYLLSIAPFDYIENKGAIQKLIADRPNGKVLDALVRDYNFPKSRKNIPIVHLSALSENEDVLKYLLETPDFALKANEVDVNGKTPLLLALDNGLPKNVKILLRNISSRSSEHIKTCLNFTDSNYNNIIYYLLKNDANRSDIELISYILNHPLFDRNALNKPMNFPESDDEYSKVSILPINYLAKKRDTKLLHLFLKNGAKVDMKDPSGLNIMHIAILNNDKVMIQSLEQRSILKKLDIESSHNGDNMIHSFIKFFENKDFVCLNIFKTLGKIGVSLNASNKDGEIPFFSLLKMHERQIYPLFTMKKLLPQFKLDTKDQNGCNIIQALLLERSSVKILQKNLSLRRRSGYVCNYNKSISPYLRKKTPLSSLIFKSHYIDNVSLKYNHELLEKSLIDEIIKKRPEMLNDICEHGTCLHMALKHPNMAEYFCTKGANPNIINPITGTTPLHDAVKLGDLSCINVFLKHGADPNIINPITGTTPLHDAIKLGKIEFATAFLKHGADPNIINPITGATPLHDAVIHRSIYYLLCNGADPNLKNNNGESPLEVAIKKEDRDKCEIIILYSKIPVDFSLISRSNIDFNLLIQRRSLGWKNVRILNAILSIDDINMQDKNGNTILHALLANGNFELLNTFFTEASKGKMQINFNIKNHNGELPIDLAIKLRNSELNLFLEYALKDVSNLNQILRCAVKYEKLEVLKKLPMSDINLDILNEEGEFLISEIKSKEILDFFLENGASVNLLDDNGMTPIHLAIDRQNYDFAKCMLINGNNTNLDVQDRLGRTYLHYAILVKNKELFSLLIENGANVNLASKEGNEPIHYAILMEDQFFINELIKAQADINKQNEEQKAPIHLVLENYKDENKMLLFLNTFKKDLLIDLKDKNGRTPLAIAALKGQANVFKYLVDNGADLETKDKDGKDIYQYAYSYALQSGDGKILSMLNDLKLKHEVNKRPSGSQNVRNSHNADEELSSKTTSKLSDGVVLRPMQENAKSPSKELAKTKNSTVVKKPESRLKRFGSISRRDGRYKKELDNKTVQQPRSKSRYSKYTESVPLKKASVFDPKMATRYSSVMSGGRSSSSSKKPTTTLI